MELTKKKPKKLKNSSSQGFECGFCGKVLKYETSLIKHVCRLKRRYVNRDKKANRFAYVAYTTFYTNQKKKPPPIENFEKSKVYDAFLRFGQYILDINAVSPDDYIHYVVNSGVGIDKWCSDNLYHKYINTLARLESWDRAIERNLLVMQSWAMQNNRSLVNFFREIEPNQALHYIKSGRISPWSLFLCESGQGLLQRFNQEQTNIMNTAINLKFWERKFSTHLNDINKAKKFLEKEGL